jgi:hypothetical protein
LVRVPVWLLDIDGVVNAVVSKPPRNVWPADAWVEVEAESAHGLSWPILTARPVVDFVRRVHDSALAEVRWHTTWREYAHNVGRALGLPEFPIQDAPEFKEESERWWKLPAAQRILAEERRALVWTDDETATELSRAERIALRRMGRALLIGPAARTGLTRRHLRQIESFLSSISAAEPAAERQE